MLNRRSSLSTARRGSGALSGSKVYRRSSLVEGLGSLRRSLSASLSIELGIVDVEAPVDTDGVQAALRNTFGDTNITVSADRLSITLKPIDH